MSSSHHSALLLSPLHRDTSLTAAKRGEPWRGEPWTFWPGLIHTTVLRLEPFSLFQELATSVIIISLTLGSVHVLACVFFLANSHVQNNVQNKNYFSGNYQSCLELSFQKNDLFLFPLFHLLSPQSLAIWFPPDYFNVLLRSLTSVSFPGNTIQALLTIPFQCLFLGGYWALISPSLLVDIWAPPGLCSSVKGGCSQGAFLGPVPPSWVLLGYLTCAQVFPSMYPSTPRGYEGGET